ncbi:MAG: type II secretion system protein [Phycisphaerales bacterium]|nr:type II secretion system protein [Phycisphaerales bacterium]
MRHRRRTSAFTLVEILIVVVILGILAAIVVPQFTNATQDAQAGNIQAQLDTLNNQLELYRARENEYPPLFLAGGATAWDDMTAGGYIKTPPVNPFNGMSSVGDDPAADGWHWGVDLNGDGDEADPGEATTLGATNYDEFNKVITDGVR